ncbi:MAG: U32 family peptidase [Desulfobacteraceae bacterium]|nr:U32 family peptidase [Desulfobacteraceae bacterium]
MKRKIELLAPGGDIDSVKAAIVAGADAIYCGLNKFNARNRATNIDLEDLNGILNLAHRHNCKVFLTLNIIIVGSEIPFLISLLNKLINTRIDGVIVQDLGVFYILSKYFKGLKIHASTQLNTHNEGQINFLNKLRATRVNLSRELNINEIEALVLIGHKNNILTEVFVHGSYCICFSGICYISSFLGGNSGNRGRCSQHCRDRYLTTLEGKNFPLNLKDNSAFFDLRKISDAGVDSIKIEGRMKRLDYVYTVVNSWKKQLKKFYDQDRLSDDNSDLYKVFNRDFSNAYLKGDINKDMFIDNPRDNSIKHLSDINTYSTNEKMEEDKLKLYEEKKQITANVKNKIKRLSIAKIPLIISISGKLDAPLKVLVKTPDTSFVVLSKSNLAKKNKKSIAKCLTYNFLLERFKSVNETEYTIKHLELENIQNDLFISFNEVTSIKKRILYTLNGSKEIIDPIDVPFLKKHIFKKSPTLAVLICSQKDVSLCNETSADIFFQLPNYFKSECSELIALFLKNKKLIPWFPSILIGENYTAAIEFLEQVQPKLIVTNNTGIAYKAYEKGIPWIAGPYLNIANSFSLLCLKEKLSCYGSFISNELSKYQIKSIINPENFKLYYSIYHPILLMTSRQCLLHQVVGCEKNTIGEECIQKCNKSSSITNLKEACLLIKKTKGNYHCIYNGTNFLNTDIITDIPDTFSNFFIDLRDIKTKTKIETDKFRIIQVFENLLKGNLDSKKELQQIIHPSTNRQYKKGI